MKKYLLVSLAALAFGSACGDSPTGTSSRVAASGKPSFHAGNGDGPNNPPHTAMIPTITKPTTLTFTTGNQVTFEWTEPTNPDHSITNYEYQLTCSPQSAGGPCTADAGTVKTENASTLSVTYTLNGAGSYTFQVRGAHDERGNHHASPYTAISVTASAVSVVPQAQVITFTSTIPAAPKYGDTYNVSATGGLSGQPVVFSVFGAGVCTISGATVSFIGVGTCNVHADQAGATVGGIQYTAANRQTQTINVAARPLTVTGIAASNKEYDGNTAATLNASSAALSGVLAVDLGTVALNLSAATGAYDTPVVGTGKTVTISGITLTGTSASKYSLTQTTTTADITQKVLTVTFSAANKEYDGLTSATITVRTPSGVVSIGGTPDDVSVIGGTANFADENAANGKTVTATGFSLSGDDAGNYSLGTVTSWTTTANITPRVLAASFSVANKVYDGTTAASITSRNVVTVVGGDDVSLTGGSATFDTKWVGTNKTVTATGFSLTGTDAGNYTLGTVTSWTTTADVTTMFNPSYFLDPINTSGSRSSFKLGSTIPVKFRLVLLNGTPYVPAAGDAMPTIVLTKIDNVAETALNEADVTTTPDAGTSFRFDGQQFILNLGTKVMTAGTWRVVAKLVDGSSTTPVEIDIRSK